MNEHEFFINIFETFMVIDGHSRYAVGKRSLDVYIVITRMTMNEHEFFINIYETFMVIDGYLRYAVGKNL